MRSRTYAILIGVGAVLLIVGAILVIHYHGPHSTCGSAHPLAAATCHRVKRRFTIGILVGVIGLIALAAGVTERVRR